LYDRDPFFGQPSQLIHQRVDLFVGGLDLALIEVPVAGNSVDAFLDIL
jgi:hypothetical protein